ETGALLEVVEILNSTLDARQLLRRVAIKIARVCRVDRCSVAQWEGGEVTPLMAQYADGRKTPDQWAAFQGMASRLLHEIPATARALDTRRPVVVNDARESDLVPREWVETFALGSYLVVPLIRRDQVTGIMTLDYCERPTPFEPWQVDLAMTIAGQLALALANARLYAEAQERLRETTTLMSVAQILSRPEPVTERMRQVAHEVGRAFGADMVGALFVVWWRTGRRFLPSETRLVEGVAAQVGLVMENAELARQTEVKLRETETLLSVSRTFSSTLDLQALLRHFLRRITQAVDADSAGVWLRDGDGEWLE